MQLEQDNSLCLGGPNLLRKGPNAQSSNEISRFVCFLRHSPVIAVRSTCQPDTTGTAQQLMQGPSQAKGVRLLGKGEAL